MSIALVKTTTKRSTENWVETYMAATEGTASPPMLRRWSAIYTIATALERCAWLTTARGKLYPNLYIFLVAPPGIGKSIVLDHARDMLETLGEGKQRIHTSPTNMSSAALADALAAAERKIDVFLDDPLKPFPSFNSLAVIIPELQTLLPEYDSAMMAILTDLYDCKHYKEMKRGGGLKIEVPNAQLSILGACTPAALNSIIPAPAWDTGFMSRVIMAYSGESVEQAMFDDTKRAAIPVGLQDDLAEIFNIYGEFGVTDDYKAAYHTWEAGKYEPAPTHPRLQNYNTRRKAFVLKLSMVASVNERSDQVINAEHFQQALTWLTDAEATMTEVFKASGMGGDSAIMHECFQFIWEIYRAEQRPVAEHRVLAFLRNRVSAHLMFQMLDIMVKSRMFEKTISTPPCYKPLPLGQHLM